MFIYHNIYFFQLKNSLNEHELMIADNHDMIQKSQKVINYLQCINCIKVSPSDLERINT